MLYPVGLDSRISDGQISGSTQLTVTDLSHKQLNCHNRLSKIRRPEELLRSFVMANSTVHQPDSGHQAWYTEDVTGIPLEARELLEQYSKIHPNEVVPHVLNVVCDKIFVPKIMPFPFLEALHPNR